MDTVTQALLGATQGMAVAPKLGRRAALWGAIGGIIPDLDTVVSAPFGEWARLEWHRGVSHSLWFGPVVGTLLGLALGRFWYRRRDPDGVGSPDGTRALVLVLVLGLFTHPILDLFTSYGTQLLAPFSRRRFVLEGIGIIDLFYSATLLVALVVSLRRVGTEPRRSVRAASIGLALTTSYVLAGVALNQAAVRRAEREITATGVRGVQVTAYSIPFQLVLRRVVARTPERIWVGYSSALSSAPLRFSSFALERHALIDRLRETREGRLFEWFAAGQTAGHVTREGDEFRVEIDDLRYGAPGIPDKGFWALAARFDRSDRLRAPPARANRPRNFGAAIRAIPAAAFGRDPRIFRVGP